MVDSSSSENKVCNTCNTCLNSYSSTTPKSKRYSVEARVYHVIDKSEIELKPFEIAQKVYGTPKPTSGQRSTVRVICTRLLQRGLIIQPYDGTYCNKITYGVMFKPLAVHNIRLHADVFCDLLSWSVVEDVGNVRIKVVFGEQRRKVSGFISCDVGMSYDACRLALNRWFALAEGRLGFVLEDVKLTTFELNKDYAGVRLDGVTCLTKVDLFGVIERVYQKEDNVVRREHKHSVPVSVRKFEENLDRGFVGVSQAQDLFELRKAVLDVTAALKFNNARLLEVEKSYFALVKNQGVMGDCLERLSKEFAVLSGVVSQMVEVLVGQQSKSESPNQDSDDVKNGDFSYVR